MPDIVNNKTENTNFNQKYIPPKYKGKAFNCPHCHAYAHQRWFFICRYRIDTDAKVLDFLNQSNINRRQVREVQNAIRTFVLQLYGSSHISGKDLSFCDHCKKYSIWVNSKMVHPRTFAAPPPIEEMPDSVKELYNEARCINNDSPRGACALLRLAVQLLIKELGENKKNLNQAISKLVERGLSPEIQQALDSIRVIGNNAVHPSHIDLKDNPKTMNTLFKLINFITEKMIKEKQQIEEIYSSLPEKEKNAIEQRDQKVNIQI